MTNSKILSIGYKINFATVSIWRFKFLIRKWLVLAFEGTGETFQVRSTRKGTRQWFIVPGRNLCYTSDAIGISIHLGHDRVARWKYPLPSAPPFRKLAPRNDSGTFASPQKCTAFDNASNRSPNSTRIYACVSLSRFHVPEVWSAVPRRIVEFVIA